MIEPQPPPTNTTGDVWAEVIADETVPAIRELMAARREQGIVKYGRPLGRDNGRDHRADAVQEALDGIVYARALGDRDVEFFFRAALLTLTLPRTL